MIKKIFYNKKAYIFFLVLTLAIISQFACSAKDKQEFYQMKIYQLKSNDQVQRVDEYLKNAYLPALHRAGIKNVGVFKPIANDTAVAKFIYVLIPYRSANDWLKVDKKLTGDANFKITAKSFVEAPSVNAPYVRTETILLEAFSGQPQLLLPVSKTAGRVFELRSYESPTEHLYEKKVAMFNTGGEISLFTKLGFNPVFYARVISGSKMPNFMYMPIFESVEQRNAQWKVFGNDPVWKDISTRPEHENKVSVSHIDSIIMHSTDYSDY